MSESTESSPSKEDKDAGYVEMKKCHKCQRAVLHCACDTNALKK